jgi:hypothetical protein
MITGTFGIEKESLVELHAKAGGAGLGELEVEGGHHPYWVQRGHVTREAYLVRRQEP